MNNDNKAMSELYSNIQEGFVDRMATRFGAAKNTAKRLIKGRSSNYNYEKILGISDRHAQDVVDDLSKLGLLDPKKKGELYAQLRDLIADSCNQPS